MSKALTALIAVLCLILPAHAEKKEKKTTPASVAKEISKAVGKGDLAAAKAAFATAKSIRDRYQDPKLGPIVKAVAKGVTHKDADLALASIETLGELKVSGSSKALGPWLKPGAKVDGEKLPLHVAALAAVGSIHDSSSLAGLQKLLVHPNPEIGAAAAAALPPYKILDQKPLIALVKKLAAVLAKLEQKAAKGKDEEAKASAEKVRAALVTAMRSLAATGESGPGTAAEWKAWAKQAAKNA